MQQGQATSPLSLWTLVGTSSTTQAPSLADFIGDMYLVKCRNNEKVRCNFEKYTGLYKNQLLELHVSGLTPAPGHLFCMEVYEIQQNDNIKKLAITPRDKTKQNEVDAITFTLSEQDHVIYFSLASAGSKCNNSWSNVVLMMSDLDDNNNKVCSYVSPRLICTSTQNTTENAVLDACRRDGIQVPRETTIGVNKPKGTHKKAGYKRISKEDVPINKRVKMEVIHHGDGRSEKRVLTPHYDDVADEDGNKLGQNDILPSMQADKTQEFTRQELVCPDFVYPDILEGDVVDDFDNFYDPEEEELFAMFLGEKDYSTDLFAGPVPLHVLINECMSGERVTPVFTVPKDVRSPFDVTDYFK